MGATLYDYWRSSASYRVRIALNVAGIPFSSVSVNLLEDEHRQDAHLARNPQGLVPALEIGSLTLTQSLAIIEYLHQTGRARFLPSSATDCARVRSISYAVAMEIHPVCNLSVASFARRESGGSIEMKDWMQAFIPTGLAAVERMLDHVDTGSCCHGDQVTMADICLVPQVYNARRWDVNLEPFLQIRAITERLEIIPAFSHAHPDRFR